MCVRCGGGKAQESGWMECLKRRWTFAMGEEEGKEGEERREEEERRRRGEEEERRRRGEERRRRGGGEKGRGCGQLNGWRTANSSRCVRNDA